MIEIAIGLLIALRPVWPMGRPWAAAGGGDVPDDAELPVTTPGWEPSLGGFPALSAMPGQFLLKDVVLLGVALWTAGEALAAASESGPPPEVYLVS